jgi:hypothetical protein
MGSTDSIRYIRVCINIRLYNIHYVYTSDVCCGLRSFG